MPFGLFGFFPVGSSRDAVRTAAAPMQGKRRGVTKPAGRARRRNRKKP